MQIDQLKEEISQKDVKLQKKYNENQEISKMVDSHKSDVQKLQKQIESVDLVIKNQEKEISNLKHVISEAEAEKQKQQKEKEMVVNERDILGSQLIRRKQELDML